MGFKITNDYVHTDEYAEWKKTGKTFGRYKGGQHKFRIRDEDGEVYFHGVSDNDSSFAPVDWAMSQWGCNVLEYKNPKSGKWDIL